jgi:hypothetical protein
MFWDIFMRQLPSFVPLRICFVLGAIALTLAFGAQPSSANQATLLLAGDAVNVPIDPIVTGVKITEQQIADWKVRNTKYQACGLCLDAQPFPGDLEE